MRVKEKLNQINYNISTKCLVTEKNKTEGNVTAIFSIKFLKSVNVKD